MNQIKKVTFLLFLFLISFTLTASELILNGDFEEIHQNRPPMWELENRGAQLESTLSDPSSGKVCLAVTLTEATDARISQWIQVKPSTLYRLSGWLRLPAEGDCRAGIGTDIFHPEEDFVSEPLKEWINVELWGKTGAGQKYLKATLFVQRGGEAPVTIYFDDIRLEQTKGIPPSGVRDFLTGGIIAGSDIPLQRGKYLPYLIIPGGILLFILLSQLLIFLIKRSLFIAIADKTGGSWFLKLLGLERRKHSRIRKRIKIIVEGRTEVYAASLMQTKNISLSGIFLTTEDITLLQIDESVNLRIYHNKEGNRYLKLSAEVIRIETIYERGVQARVKGYGLTFSRLSPSIEKELRKIIAGKQEKELVKQVPQEKAKAPANQTPGKEKRIYRDNPSQDNRQPHRHREYRGRRRRGSSNPPQKGPEKRNPEKKNTNRRHHNKAH